MNEKVYNTIIERIYSSSVGEYSWEDTLIYLSEILDYQGIAILPRNVENNFLKLSSSKTKISDKEYYDHYIKKSPMLKFTSELYKKKTLIRDIDYLSKEEMEKSSFYFNFLNKYDCAFSEKLYFSEKSFDFSISAQRNKKYLDSNTKQNVTIEYFRNHFSNSIFFMEKMNFSSFLNNRLSIIYDQMNLGICLVKKSGDLLFLNKSMHDYTGDIFKIVGNKLYFLSPYNQKLWEEMIAQPAEEAFIPTNSPIASFKTSQGGKLLARIMPVPDIILDHMSVNARCKMIFFYGLRLHSINIIELLRALGLSLSEAKLAQKIGQLETLKESAAHLNISYESARSCLKVIFSKLNISSQNELVALVTHLSFIR